MRILTRLLGWTESESPASTASECMHGVLTPHWSNAGDIGKEHRIVGYRCQSCLQVFDPGEAYWLWLRAVDRLRDLEGTPAKN